MNKLLKIFAVAIVALAAFACQLRPLEGPVDKVIIEVTVNTDNVSNVTSDIYNPHLLKPAISTGMVRCMFYDPSTNKLVGQSFISDKKINEKGQEVISGVVSIAPGTYNLVCYNFDTPNTLVRNENSYENITAYTSEVSNAIKTHADGKGLDGKNATIYYDPDHLVVSRDPDLLIIPQTEAYTIKTTASTCIDTYYLQVRIQGGKGAISTMNAVIDGLSPENRFAKDVRNTSNPSAVFFDLHRDIDEKIAAENKDVICGLFSTFGKIENAPSNAYIVITLTSSEGTKYEKTISLDKVFKTEDAIKRHWLIIDDVIVIPDPPAPPPSGGFEPRIEDWDEDHGTIVL